jgi:hypothetical protein
VFAQVSDGFQVSVDWPRLVLVGSVVGDWLASNDAAWLAIVNRVGSAADRIDGMLIDARPKEATGRSATVLVVELPGIEPVAKIELSWENTRFERVKRRESTRNTASPTQQDRNRLFRRRSQTGRAQRPEYLLISSCLYNFSASLRGNRGSKKAIADTCNEQADFGAARPTVARHADGTGLSRV